ncbi:xanthine oxidase [Thecamonas trahens ATCC 50062]|uniref:Xanthine oxidase n=1 Tax=Thecamonas trahens ATCC 50062 TaxID=461836 RepID=A0A0L0DV28_THETB|nr:xanthine oxidase [Thecamonas trahens ATCC 50062]KNC55941.1 xanthine oxidase [Thecamonas trahens ATCC 50062]|eukprot:XP_013752713.1 xanthine oxidase [Thecamonas trahens ATCC 50062]
MTASPISDLNPLWMALGAEVVVTSAARGERRIPFNELYVGYRKTAVEADEVMVKLVVPLAGENEYVRSYKQSRRREDDIAIVGASFRVKLDPETGAVVDAGLAYGGMAAWTKSAVAAAEVLMSGEKWSDALVRKAMAQLDSVDVPLAPNAPGGQVGYRRELAKSFLYKFFLYVSVESGLAPVEAREITGALLQEHKPLSQGRQEYASSAFEAAYDGVLSPPVSGGVHMPEMHASALLQATGEAVYVDDIPVAAGSLFGAPLLSSVARGTIERIETSAALALDPSVAVYTADDVPGMNVLGAIVYDEEVIVSKEITSQGQLLGMVVASSADLARLAARKVNVVLTEAAPDAPELVVTIDEAVAAGQYMSGGNKMKSGDVEGALEGASHVLEGTTYVGGQEHFYLETFATLAVPVEGEQMKVYASTQNPSKTQKFVSRVLGVPSAKVAVHVKRIGGGFGGKETRTCPLSAAVALAAKLSGKPVRCMLDRDEDMVYSGTRHPYKGVYKVGYNDDGKILGLDIDLYSNAGFSLDLSGSVMDRALFHVDNAYKIPAVGARGWLCKTNTPSNTAFRGFGGPQSMLICESWIDNVARELGKDPAEVRAANFYEPDATTHYGQVLTDNRLEAVWGEVMSKSEYETRRAEVAAFNAAHRWRKRGLAAVPTKFGMSFTAKFLNQAGALVHVYQDGTVLVSHGGIEMGQGLHTKMAQVAASAFGIPVSDVYVDETATDKVANTVPTAASVSSDINGMAVLDACEQILARLATVEGVAADAPLAEKALAAHLQRINLSANGFYKTPDIGFEFDPTGETAGSGMPFNYFCYGAAVAEVEIDVLTGDHVVTRADLVMDVGDSLNPAIDLGQVEGAFVQGMGLFTTEELIKLGNGHVFTRGPSFYKIPAFSDIPSIFNVSLLKDAPNSRAIHSSKGVGEPPLFLAASVFFAIKDAVGAARVDAGLGSGAFDLHSPASSERIRMACGPVAPELE